MTTKASYGFVLWAVPRFHRSAILAPQGPKSADLSPAGKALFPAARQVEISTGPTSEKITAGPNEAGGCQFTYH